MRKAVKKGPRLVVAMQFNWEGAEPAWGWEIHVSRQFTIKSSKTYTKKQAARRIAKKVAKQYGIELVN